MQFQARLPVCTTHAVVRLEREGSVLVCVLVCLGIVAAMVVSLTEAALHARRQVRVERHLHQAELLIDAGWRRAAARITADDDYQGEVWTLDADALPGFDGARVAIELLGQAEQPGAIRITAEVSLDSPRPVRRSCEFTLKRSQSPGANKPT